MPILLRFSAPVYHSAHVPVFSFSVYSVTFMCSNILHRTWLSHILITLSLLLAFRTHTFPPTIGHSPYIPIFPYPDLLKFNHMVPRFVNYLIQGWRKYGSLHLLLSQFSVPHFCPTSFSVLWRTCVYIHMSVYRLYINYWCYQITLQLNIFTQIGAVRSVDWIFIIGAPVWRWLGEYVTLSRTFYSILLKTGSSSSSRYRHILLLIAFLDEAIIRNIMIIQDGPKVGIH